MKLHKFNFTSYNTHFHIFHSKHTNAPNKSALTKYDSNTLSGTAAEKRISEILFVDS